MQHTGDTGLEAKGFVMGIAVFVVDGHDIDLYPDAEAAALEVEGYDAMTFDYFGADGTVYHANVEGPESGPVRLHPSRETRLEHLVQLLRAEAQYRGLPLPPETPDSPEAISGAASRPTGEAPTSTPVVGAACQVSDPSRIRSVRLLAAD